MKIQLKAVDKLISTSLLPILTKDEKVKNDRPSFLIQLKLMFKVNLLELVE